MVHEYKPNFPHRLNMSGSYDSICTVCHLTVATANRERELVQRERSHKCDPIRLAHPSEQQQQLRPSTITVCQQLR